MERYSYDRRTASALPSFDATVQTNLLNPIAVEYQGCKRQISKAQTLRKKLNFTYEDEPWEPMWKLCEKVEAHGKKVVDMLRPVFEHGGAELQAWERSLQQEDGPPDKNKDALLRDADMLHQELAGVDEMRGDLAGLREERLQEGREILETMNRLLDSIAQVHKWYGKVRASFDAMQAPS